MAVFLPFNLHLMPTTLGTAAGGGLADGVTLMAVGMLVVFVSLLVLLGLIVAMNRLLPPEAPRGAPPIGRVPPQHLAVIAAAATAALNHPVKVTRVRAVTEEPPSPETPA